MWSEPAEPPAPESDLTELRAGNVTVSPLDFDLTRHNEIETMRGWGLKA